MSLASALTIAGELIKLIGKVLPKRKPKQPKYQPIKPVPPRPIKGEMDPHEPKDRR